MEVLLSVFAVVLISGSVRALASGLVALPNALSVLVLTALAPTLKLSVATLKVHQMTNASGIQSMIANVGGAIGTSICATMISRFSQVHQNMLVQNLTYS